jgi:hypothetical protein
MKVVKYNISKAGRKYQNNQGQEKTIWNNIGTMTEFHKDDGSIGRIIEIPAISLEASIFPIEPNEQSKVIKVVEKLQKRAAELDVEFPYEDISPEDIPF